MPKEYGARWLIVASLSATCTCAGCVDQPDTQPIKGDVIPGCQDPRRVLRKGVERLPLSPPCQDFAGCQLNDRRSRGWRQRSNNSSINMLVDLRIIGRRLSAATDQDLAGRPIAVTERRLNHRTVRSRSSTFAANSSLAAQFKYDRCADRVGFWPMTVGLGEAGRPLTISPTLMISPTCRMFREAGVRAVKKRADLAVRGQKERGRKRCLSPIPGKPNLTKAEQAIFGGSSMRCIKRS